MKTNRIKSDAKLRRKITGKASKAKAWNKKKNENKNSNVKPKHQKNKT